MRRGINLGCGKVTLPCERPIHHHAIPEELYTAPDIEWDNVDWNEAPGVNKVVDLFDYPWRTEDGTVLPDNTYDVAIAAHIAEHIPHHIVWNGEFVHRHPEYQDGWFAWFGELHRVMKPGGKAFVLVPYAWSNSGISDPTHTRYLTFASFNYFSAEDLDSPSSFRYRMNQRWTYVWEEVVWHPHDQAFDVVGRKKLAVSDLDAFDERAEFWRLSLSNINMMVEFMMPLVAVK